MSKETIQFKAEVKQLLDLVVNSLYSHKEIFLRELISNSSDALDKARYLSLTDSSLGIGSTSWKIKLELDKDKGLITIKDNGIGMDKEDLVNALGTIAHSGTKEFVELLKEKNSQNSVDLIGQFGVGFYSAFMVSEYVEVITKKAGKTNAYKWSSKADGEFEIEEYEKSDYGTDVILKLKDEDKEYLDIWRIKEIIKKYSDFIEYPIVIDVEKDGKLEEEITNSMKAVWMKDKSEISEDEYNEFYKHISHDFQHPLETIHFKVEGASEFTALLFIPSKAPFDILYKDFKFGPSLYVKKVQIIDHYEGLLPVYLRFVKGVFDSADLPLNVSREFLQNNKHIEIMKKNSTKKVLDALKNIKANDIEKYKKFFEEFGRVLKEGIHFDFSKKEEIAELMIFPSTKTAAGETTDLNLYVERMKEEQKEIYYITGKSIEELINSPYIEKFKEKEIEVAFFTDEVDDIIMNSLGEFKGKKLKSVLSGNIDLFDSEKENIEKLEKEYSNLLEAVQTNLSDKISKVIISKRLKDSLCCLINEEGKMNPSMKKLLESMGQPIEPEKKILEINPNAKIFEEMNKLADLDKNSSTIKDFSIMLYDLGLILEGEPLENPAMFSKMIAKLMDKGMLN